MNTKKSASFWFLIIIGILLILIMIVGQTGALLNYNLMVSIGLQESIKEVTDVGVIWAKGFAFGDTVFYIPLFITGIIGLLKRRVWGIYSMFGALSITVYWSIVNLYSFWLGKDMWIFTSDKYILISIVLPLITIYGLWGIWYLYKNEKSLK